MGWLCVDIIGFDAVFAVFGIMGSSVVAAQAAAAIFIEIVAYATGQQCCLTVGKIWDWCMPHHEALTCLLWICRWFKWYLNIKYDKYG